MAISTNFNGLFNQRFFNNFLPRPASNNLVLGERTPNFMLPNVQNNTEVKLSDYWEQKPVLLYFTRIFTENQYCPLCYPHIKELNENYESFLEAGIEVFMITSTDIQQSKLVVRDLGLKMPLLSDSSCQVFRDYNLGQALGAPLPGQFLLNKQGNLCYKHLFSCLSSNAGVEKLLQAVSFL